MAQYDTWTKTKDEITVTVSKAKSENAGDRLVAFLEWLASKRPVDPGYGQPAPGKPTHPIAPGGEKPDQGLPPTGGAPPKPDQGLPGAQPGVDNSLPREHIDEIAKIVLKNCFQCNTAQPK